MLLKELVSKVPWESAFEGIGVHECWSLIKSHLLKSEEAGNFKVLEVKQTGQRPAWVSRDLLKLW